MCRKGATPSSGPPLAGAAFWYRVGSLAGLGGQDPGLDLALGQQIPRKERIPPNLSLCSCC